MPLTSITIENFKGISAPVTIPIRPLTLLFGKNSAGKSTILQALHYLREVLENQRPDPDRTQLGGDAIDLGGFQSLVHRNELDRRIRIRVACSLDDDGIPNVGITFSESIEERLQSLSMDLNDGGKLDLAWIEVITAWEMGKGAYIAEYAVGLDEGELIRLQQAYGFPPELFSFNFDHSTVWGLNDQFSGKGDYPEALTESMLSLFEENYENPVGPTLFSSPVPLKGQPSIIPDPDKSFCVDAELVTEEFLFWSMVAQALTGPLSLLLRELRGIRYLGPIREVPPRNYRAPRTPDESRWANGLGAWDALARNPDLAEKAGQFLQEVLKLGYSIQREERISIDAEGEVMAALRLLVSQYEERDAAFLRAMVLGPLEQLPRQPVVQLHDEVNDIDVDPSDIGVGVSQVLPVVVGALDSGSPGNPCRIFAVEQPELHVHPAVQVALGDVFIEALKGTERTLLIETHSEHLLLRLLRRVRESDKSTDKAIAPAISEDELSVVYVRSTDKGVELTPLSVNKGGDFDEPWPEGFFDERDPELF